MSKAAFFALGYFGQMTVPITLINGFAYATLTDLNAELSKNGIIDPQLKLCTGQAFYKLEVWDGKYRLYSIWT